MGHFYPLSLTTPYLFERFIDNHSHLHYYKYIDNDSHYYLGVYKEEDYY